MKNKFIILSVILFFSGINITCASSPASKEYFIDASKGKDSNDGRTPSSAWRSISKVNQTRFSAGDKILFKRGEEWREELRINSEGTQENPVIFGAYGDGDKPVIKGSDKLSGFEQIQGSINVWRAKIQNETYWVWFIKDGKIIWGDKQDSKISLLNEFDWFQEDNFIYLFSHSNPGDLYTSVEASARMFCINAELRNFIQIENLHLQFAKNGCLKIFNNTIVKDNILEYSGINDTEKWGDGVWVVGSNNYIAGNTISENSSHGVNVNPSKYETNNNLIEHNTIYNNYHNNLDIRSGDGGTAKGNIVRFNHIYCTDDFNRDGVNGIFLQGRSPSNLILNTEVYNNIVHNQTGSGIHVSKYVDDVLIHYNTVHSTKGENTACFYIYNSSGRVEMKNNIGSDAATWVIRLETSANKKFEDNVYNQSPGKNQNIARIGGQTFKDFNKYKIETGLDKNSLWRKELKYNDPERKDFSVKENLPVKAGALADRKNREKNIQIGAEKSEIRRE